MSPQDRLSLVLVQLLEPAMAEGMPEPEARAIYESLCTRYARATAEFPDFPALVIGNIRAALDHAGPTEN